MNNNKIIQIVTSIKYKINKNLHFGVLSKKIPIFYEWRQIAVSVTTNCSIRCLGCSIWDNESVQPKFPKAYRKLVNISGAEATMSEKIVALLRHYKKNNNKVRLWTNGVVTSDRLAVLLPYCDEIMVFVPTFNPGEFRLETGWDGMETLRKTIELAKSYNVPVIAHTSVTSERVDRLPDIYEGVLNAKIPWLLHVNKASFSNKETIGYIDRFKAMKNVFVLNKTQSKSRKFCPEVPRESWQNRASAFSLSWQAIVNRLPAWIRL